MPEINGLILLGSFALVAILLGVIVAVATRPRKSSVQELYKKPIVYHDKWHPDGTKIEHAPERYLDDEPEGKNHGSH